MRTNSKNVAMLLQANSGGVPRQLAPVPDEYLATLHTFAAAKDEVIHTTSRDVQKCGRNITRFCGSFSYILEFYWTRARPFHNFKALDQ